MFSIGAHRRSCRVVHAVFRRNEREQILVHTIFARRAQAVRVALVDLELGVLDQLDGLSAEAAIGTI